MHRTEIHLSNYKLVTLVLLAIFLSPLSVDATENANTISMIRLLANPSQFQGHLIIVEGYLSYLPEGDQEQAYLYLSKDNFEHDITSNSVSVRLPSFALQQIEKYSEEYVEITAEFDATNKGPWGLSSGTLKNVVEIKLHGPAFHSSKFSLHQYSLAITPVSSHDSIYQDVRQLSLSWLEAVRKGDLETLSMDFAFTKKQEADLANKAITPRANWLLFDSEYAISKRFADVKDVFFYLYQHTESRYGTSYYACLFAKEAIPEAPINNTNELPGIYGKIPAVCIDVLKLDGKFSVSFLPFLSASMQ